jgi:hypothetical protein
MLFFQNPGDTLLYRWAQSILEKYKLKYHQIKQDTHD